jgi:hypothetical protein
MFLMPCPGKVGVNIHVQFEGLLRMKNKAMVLGSKEIAPNLLDGQFM